MNDSLETLRGEVLDRIQRANSEKEIEQLRVEVLGRSGSITLRLRGLKDLPAEQRPRTGEALNQLRRVDPTTAAAIPEFERIIAFRNVLIHGYADVDNLLVWGVVESRLGSLRSVLSSLLEAG